MNRIIPNDWDYKQIEKFGFVYHGNYVLLSIKEFERLKKIEEEAKGK